MPEKKLESYKVESEKIIAFVDIKRTKDFVPLYDLRVPEIAPGTLALLDKVRTTLLTEIPIKISELMDVSALESLKKKFYDKAIKAIQKEIPSLNQRLKEVLAGLLIQEMFGLGRIEFLLADPNTEEVVVNGSKEPVWVYHKKYGWLKTNIQIKSENDILNYANNIGRKVGRQVTILNPLMDAHLPSGDRVNATLFPVSTHGHTITIRKFRRSPWTIVDFIENKTINYEVAAWVWLAVQFELNMIVTGGTATGKTSLLNVFMNFVPPNHRILSIEDTRELQLPRFLHWIPLTTREPNPEGLGAVTMLDLLVNSLRMRPDRIIVGEIRRAREAEVLFEAMHTGHSVYATLHADTAEQALKRLCNPPINVPETVVGALHLFVVAFRDRRTGIRRMLQLSEIIPGAESGLNINTLYRWRPSTDEITKTNESYRIVEEIKNHTGMNDEEIKKNLEEKVDILKWLVKNHTNDINKIGRIVAIYYTDPEFIFKNMEKSVDEVIEEWLK